MFAWLARSYLSPNARELEGSFTTMRQDLERASVLTRSLVTEVETQRESLSKVSTDYESARSLSINALQMTHADAESSSLASLISQLVSRMSPALQQKYDSVRQSLTTLRAELQSAVDEKDTFSVALEFLKTDYKKIRNDLFVALYTKLKPGEEYTTLLLVKKLIDEVYLIREDLIEAHERINKTKIPRTVETPEAPDYPMSVSDRVRLLVSVNEGLLEKVEEYEAFVDDGDLASHKSKLELAVADEEARTKALTQQNVSLTSDLNRAIKQKEDLGLENSTLRGELELARVRIAQHEVTLGYPGKELLIEENKRLLLANTALAQKQIQLESEAAAQQKVIDDFEWRLDTTKQALDTNRGWAAKVEPLEAKLCSAKENLEQKTRQYETTLEKLSIFTTKLTDAERLLAASQHAHQDDITRLRTAEKALEDQKAQTQAWIQTFEKAAAAATGSETQVKALEEQNSTRGQRIIELENISEHYKTQKISLERFVQSLQTEVKELDRRLDAKSDLERRGMSCQKQDHDALAVELARLRGQLTAIMSIVHEVKNGAQVSNQNLPPDSSSDSLQTLLRNIEKIREATDN